MKELVAAFLVSALRNLFEEQPDLSDFTRETEEREPNLSFHLTNELWRYLFWLQCDFDVTKANLGDRRPDIVFHRRGIHALNFLVIEVKRWSNLTGVENDLDKIKTYWFANPLSYRFGASMKLDEDTKKFSVILLENVAGDASLTLTDTSRGFYQSVRRATTKRREKLEDMVKQITFAERDREDTCGLMFDLDKAICELYGLNE